MSNRVPLPAGTVLGKSFEYGIDVKLGGVWQAIRRISGWQPAYPPATTDTTTYDDLGNPNTDVTGRGFTGAFTVQGNRSLTTGLYLPELEAILAAAKGKGEQAVLEVRWYHKPEIGTPNPTDAGTAVVTVEASRQNTGNADIEVYSVTLTGKGEFTPITNPFAGWGATAPIVTAVSPSGVGEGDLVTITGSGLLGATSVTFDAVESTDLLVMDNGTIVATVPAGSAGDVPVLVTTPGGVSAAFTYTRGA